MKTIIADKTGVNTAKHLDLHLDREGYYIKNGERVTDIMDEDIHYSELDRIYGKTYVKNNFTSYMAAQRKFFSPEEIVGYTKT